MATEPQGNLQKPRFGPSDRLIAMFRACSRDPTEAVKARLQRMLDMFLRHCCSNKMTKDLAVKCCCEARDWYYKILEHLVGQERKRLGFSDVSGLLEIDLIQCCLVACCLEISICSNSLPCDFPRLLQILKMAPYHFWRVIELVLRAEVRLPHVAVKHLALVEEKVLESLAWTSNSPLWEEIRANKGRLPTCQQVMPPAWLEDPKKKDLQPDPNLPGADARLGADLSTSAVNRPQGNNSLHLFARKVYSLMGCRLRKLCSILEISDELRWKIWTCFENSLVLHCNHLMVDLHLDQLLMCAIYIMAKITKMEIPFKQIMKYYKSLPNASKNVCKNVLISGRYLGNSLTENNNNEHHSKGIPTPDSPLVHYPGPLQEQRGDLIYFYNHVYTTTMQYFAKQFAPTSGNDTPPLSPYPQQRKASPQKHQLCNNPSISVSPYNPETSSPSTTGLCYYFKSSPPELLREINNMIRTGRSPSRRGYVVPLDKEEEEGEDGPSAKRLCLDDQSAWQRRLRKVVNDRVIRTNQDQPSPVTKSNLH